MIVFALAAASSRTIGTDLEYYLNAADALRKGGSPYVGPDGVCAETVGCFPYPPPVLLLYVALLAIPPTAVGTVVFAVDALLAIVVGAVLIAPLRREVRPWTGIAIALFFPLLLELNLLNMNLLTLAFVLGAWATRDRPATGGLLLASAAVKTLGAPIAIFYFAAGRWRQLGWAAATAAVVAVVTAPWVRDLWPGAIDAILWRATQGDVPGIRPVPMRGTVAYLALAVAACALIATSGIASRRSPRHAGDLHALALAAVPLLAQLIQYPALVLALPLLIATVRKLSSRPALLTLPGAAWAAMNMPIWDPGWRFGGYLATIAIGVALFLVPALRPRTFA